MRWVETTSLFVTLAVVIGCEPANPTVPETRELRLEAVSPTHLSGEVASLVTTLPAVRVTRVDGNPAPGVRVTFRLLDSGAEIADESTTTDRNGVARLAWWRLGTVARAYTLRASIAPGDAGVKFTAEALPGPTGKLIEISPPTARIANMYSSVGPLQVRVEDRFGNPAPGRLVTFRVVSGNGHVAGDRAWSDARGVATSGAWTLGGPGLQEVVAEATGVTTILSALAGCCFDELTYVRDGGIYVATLPEGQLQFNLQTAYHRQLTPDQTRNARPAWSPDGSRIAFTQYGNDYFGDIYIMNADGSHAVAFAIGGVPPHPGLIGGFTSSTWAPDGRQLAMARGDCTYYCQVLLATLPTGDRLELVADQAGDPAWSPDGTGIAYVSLSGDDGYHALHVMNPDGSDVRVISPFDEGAIFHPTWSPDSRRVAFTKCLQGVCDMRVVSAEGGDQRVLAAGIRAFDAAWSPDGEWLAVTLWNPSGPSVALISVRTGAGPFVLWPGYHPAWRPRPAGPLGRETQKIRS